jgi:hypothetical protein
MSLKEKVQHPPDCLKASQHHFVAFWTVKMDFDNPFAGLFSDSECASQEIVEMPNNDDDAAHLLPFPGSTEPTATPQRPVSDVQEQSHPANLVLLQLSEWDGEKPMTKIRLAIFATRCS